MVDFSNFFFFLILSVHICLISLTRVIPYMCMCICTIHLLPQYIFCQASWILLSSSQAAVTHTHTFIYTVQNKVVGKKSSCIKLISQGLHPQPLYIATSIYINPSIIHNHTLSNGKVGIVAKSELNNRAFDEFQLSWKKTKNGGFGFSTVSARLAECFETSFSATLLIKCCNEIHEVIIS